MNSAFCLISSRAVRWAGAFITVAVLAAPASGAGTVETSSHGHVGPAPPAGGSIVVSPLAIDFGTVRPRTVSEPHDVVITNVGLEEADFAATLSTGFHFAAGGCPRAAVRAPRIRLAPQASCPLPVFYRPRILGPSDLGVPTVGTLTLTGSYPPQPIVVSLRGTPEAEPPTERVAEVDEQQIRRALGKLKTGLPQMLRGGSSREMRLRAFKTSVAGELRLRIVASADGRAMLVANAKAQIEPGERQRLRFALTRKGRQLLRHPNPVRVRATVVFHPEGWGAYTKTHRITVPRP